MIKANQCNFNVLLDPAYHTYVSGVSNGLEIEKSSCCCFWNAHWNRFQQHSVNALHSAKQEIRILTIDVTAMLCNDACVVFYLSFTANNAA